MRVSERCQWIPKKRTFWSNSAKTVQQHKPRPMTCCCCCCCNLLWVGPIIRAGQLWIASCCGYVDVSSRLLSVILVIQVLCVRSIYSSLYLWHTGDYVSSVSELLPSRWLYRVAPTTSGLLLPRLVLELCITSELYGCRLTNDFIAGWHFPEMKDLISLRKCSSLLLLSLRVSMSSCFTRNHGIK